MSAKKKFHYDEASFKRESGTLVSIPVEPDRQPMARNLSADADLRFAEVAAVAEFMTPETADWNDVVFGAAALADLPTSPATPSKVAVPERRISYGSRSLPDTPEPDKHKNRSLRVRMVKQQRKQLRRSSSHELITVPSPSSSPLDDSTHSLAPEAPLRDLSLATTTTTTKTTKTPDSPAAPPVPLRTESSKTGRFATMGPKMLVKGKQRASIDQSVTSPKRSHAPLRAQKSEPLSPDTHRRSLMSRLLGRTPKEEGPSAKAKAPPALTPTSPSRTRPPLPPTPITPTTPQPDTPDYTPKQHKAVGEARRQPSRRRSASLGSITQDLDRTAEYAHLVFPLPKDSPPLHQKGRPLPPVPAGGSHGASYTAKEAEHRVCRNPELYQEPVVYASMK